MNKQMCVNCKELVNINIKEEYINYQDNENNVNFLGKVAYCEKCGTEIFNAEIEEYNQERLEEVLKQNVISKEEIEQILAKYKIGKRPLSLLLGFGEITITRYLNGYIPTKKNSDYLRTILNSPEEYYSVLLANKDLISDNAFVKSSIATKTILGILKEDTVLNNVSKYIVNKIEVSNMALQKILYYIQMFSMCFLKKPAFTSSCKAWKYGPVYGTIYHKYKTFNGDVIVDEGDSPSIDPELKPIVDNVVKYFGCYTGYVLKNFTHNEAPWNDTDSNGIIEKESIKKFGNQVIAELNIQNVSEISKYSEKMFKQYLLDSEEKDG